MSLVPSDAPVTFLRLKRHRDDAALDEVRIALPAKRRRLRSALDGMSLVSSAETSQDTGHLRFKRLRTDTDLSDSAEWVPQKHAKVKIIDVDASFIREPPNKEAAEIHSHTSKSGITCNGVPLQRTIADDGTDAMFDVFEQTSATEEDKAQQYISRSIGYVNAEDIQMEFESDASTDDIDTSDFDARSIDYPSTPEDSEDDDSEDEFLGETARAQEAYHEYPYTAADEGFY